MAAFCASTPMQSQYMKFFERLDAENEEDHWYKCLAENCNKRLQGKKRGNLKVHLQNKHQSFYELNVRYAGLNQQALAVKRIEFIQHCTEMVTANCRPFNALNDSGFKKMVAEKYKLLKATGYGDGLTPPQYTAVKEYALSLASRVEQQIKAEVRGKFVSLMIDSAKKNNRSILGLSLQYSHNGGIVIRSIGMIAIHQSQTAPALLEIISNRLEHFEIKMSQVIAITADNASTMVSLMNLANDNNDESGASFDFDVPGHDGGNTEQIDRDEIDVQNALFECEINNEQVGDELRTLMDSTKTFSSLLENLGNEFAMKHLHIAGLRCAAHTLQLAVRAALDLKKFSPLISICRLACKELRKPSNQFKLKALNIPFKLPRMDCETRWNSTHLMVSIYFTIRYNHAMRFLRINIFVLFYRELMWLKIEKRASILQMLKKSKHFNR